MKKPLSKELEDRGFIHQIAGPNLKTIFDGEKRTIFQGIDPSADSAHAGNFVLWMLLRHLVEYGHRIIFLFGGGTGLIGDPKPDAERQLKDPAEVQKNVQKLRAQAESFFPDGTVEFVDNMEWLSELKLIEFLRDIGKHYTVNELIKKDAIATRLASDTGLSYTEFAYPLLQGYDYYQLYKTKGCTVQIGGSDQWGNIISGVDLIRRKEQAEVYAATVPLIIDKTTGKKFGKSEGNAVWLDPEQTSPFQFYQFWLNMSDDSVVEYLKLFTLIDLETIEEIAREHEMDPGSRVGQKRLALAVTALVHGDKEAEAVGRVSEVLFGGRNVEGITEEEKKILLDNAPTKKITTDTPLVELLLETELATSKREARTFIQSGAISLNGERVSDPDIVITKDTTERGLVLLRRGKKQYRVLNVGD